MSRRRLASFVFAALALCAFAQPISRSVVCFVVSPEGDSAEGNALYQKYMALGPEIVRSYLPSPFTLGSRGLKQSSAGEFRYSASAPEVLERQAKVGLSSIRVDLAAPLPPKAWKSAVVEFKLADLASAQGLVQPGQKAIELAARKLKLSKGQAWIESIEYAGQGAIRATVAFLKK